MVSLLGSPWTDGRRFGLVAEGVEKALCYTDLEAGITRECRMRRNSRAILMSINTLLPHWLESDFRFGGGHKNSTGG